MSKEEKFTIATQGGEMKPGEKCSSPDKPTQNNSNEPPKTDTSKSSETKK